MRKLAAVLGAALLIAGVPMGSALAADPQPLEQAEANQAGDVQTVAGGCDLKLSVNGGPLVDGTIEVRVYQDYGVHGFGYPPDTAIWMNGLWQGDTLPGSPWFVARTDASGSFVTTHRVPGDDPIESMQNWTLVAYDPAPGGCSDSVNVLLLPATPFVDIGPYAAWDGAFRMDIIWLYQSGITGGCTPTLFCPKDPVTREQMASFLARALELAPTSVDYFTDDDTSIHQGAINRLAAAGITGGCGDTRYCPKRSVTREQMAAFLKRALHPRQP